MSLLKCEVRLSAFKPNGARVISLSQSPKDVCAGAPQQTENCRTPVGPSELVAGDGGEEGGARGPWQ